MAENEGGRVPREKLESSNIESAGYDPEKRILSIEFKSGDVFNFTATLEEATAFYTSESKGRYFSQNIKGKLPGQKMTGKCDQCGDGPGWIGDLCADCGCGHYAEAARVAR